MKRLALATLLALAVSTPAQAAPFTPPLSLAYEQAAVYWHGAPAQTVDMEIVPDALIAGYNGETSCDGEQCYLYISRTLAKPQLFPRACAVIFHEVGHLKGYEHSSNPRNIMFPEVTFIPNRCMRIALRLM